MTDFLFGGLTGSWLIFAGVVWSAITLLALLAIVLFVPPFIADSRQWFREHLGPDRPQSNIVNLEERRQRQRLDAAAGRRRAS